MLRLEGSRVRNDPSSNMSNRSACARRERFVPDDFERMNGKEREYQFLAIVASNDSSRAILFMAFNASCKEPSRCWLHHHSLFHSQRATRTLKVCLTYQHDFTNQPFFT